MNWVETEMAVIARGATLGPLDAWLELELVWKSCDHRWRVERTFIPFALRGFFTLPVRTVCTRCKAEA